MRSDERARRWSNVIKVIPLCIPDDLKDVMQCLPKDLQPLALDVRGMASATGFCSLPFQDDAFDRFEAYCLNKVGRVRGQYVPEETPTRYLPPDAVQVFGLGPERLPGLALALREIARGACRCPAPAPDEVDIVHVRSTLGGSEERDRCLAVRAQALEEGWALRVVTAEPPLPVWPVAWVRRPLSLQELVELLVQEPACDDEETGPPSTAEGMGLVSRLWAQAVESGVSRREAAASVVVSSFHYPTLHLAIARRGGQWVDPPRVRKKLLELYGKLYMQLHLTYDVMKEEGHESPIVAWGDRAFGGRDVAGKTDTRAEDAGGEVDGPA